MTKDEALKLALEALESSDELINGSEEAINCGYSVSFDFEGNNKLLNKAINAIKEALAQPEQELVEWYSIEGETRRYGVGMVECTYAIGRDEVVHVVTHESVKDVAMKHLPTQYTWVGLDDDEMLMIYGQHHEGRKYSLGRMVEAKLKEKNGFGEAAHGIKE